MATWQFDVYVVPQDSPIPTESDDGMELPRIPARETLHAQETLTKVFGLPWLMLDNWLVYGDERGTRVDMLFSDDDMVEVSVRLDANAPNESAVASLCTFANQLKCAFFSPELRQFITSQPELVKLALSKSRAAKYVSNPRGFIADLTR